MELIRIIPENKTLDSTIHNFRKKFLELDIKNSKNISVFLVSIEKFERVWEVVFHDKENELLNNTKENWIKLIKQKRVLVLEENIKNLVDLF